MRLRPALGRGLRLSIALLGTCAVACDFFEEGPGECSTGFNDPGALSQLVDGASSTFAYPTGRDAGGRLEPCDERIHETCWTYRERCREHWIRVDPLTGGHFHLAPDDEEVEVGVCESEFGLFTETADGCSLLEPARVPRTLMSHTQNDWIKLWLEEEATGEAVAFDLRRVMVDADKPIQLWVKRADGTWLCWERLDHSTAWEVEAEDIMEARIRGADDGPGPYSIGGFALTE